MKNSYKKARKDFWILPHHFYRLLHSFNLLINVIFFFILEEKATIWEDGKCLELLASRVRLANNINFTKQSSTQIYRNAQFLCIIVYESLDTYIIISTCNILILAFKYSCYTFSSCFYFICKERIDMCFNFFILVRITCIF